MQFDQAFRRPMMPMQNTQGPVQGLAPQMGGFGGGAPMPPAMPNNGIPFVPPSMANPRFTPPQKPSFEQPMDGEIQRRRQYGRALMGRRQQPKLPPQTPILTGGPTPQIPVY